MKRYCRYHRFKLASILIVAILAACQPAGTPATQTPAAPVPLIIECHTAYRPSVSVPIEREDTLSVTKSEGQKTVSYPDLVFQASYLDDAYEGRSLKISVTSSSGQDELQAGLYQMSKVALPENQFVEHGFTGLVYVYHPTSRAELQYWCLAR